MPIWLLPIGGAFAQSGYPGYPGYPPPPSSTDGSTNAGGYPGYPGYPPPPSTTTTGMTTSGYPPSGYPPPGYPPATTGGTTGTGMTGTTTSGTTTSGTTTSGTTTSGTTTSGTTGTSSSGFQVHVIWNEDQSTYPIIQQASVSGPVGNVALVHLSIPTTGDYHTSYNIKKLTIEEDNGHHDDTLLAGSADYTQWNGQWSPLCNDPGPNAPNAPSMLYYDAGWSTAYGHNGPHTITAIVESSTYNSEGPPTVQSFQSIIHVEVRNLVIQSMSVDTAWNPATPSVPVGTPENSGSDNPFPILWDPDTMSSVTITGNVSSIYYQNHPVTLEIFSTTQSLIKTLHQTVYFGGGSVTPIPFHWDGRSDNVDYNANPAGPMMMPKGIYLYRFTVEGGDYRRDYDVDKSPFLTVDSQAPTSEFLTDDGSTAIHREWYSLASGDQPDPGRDASEGQIQVYDQETSLTALLSLPGLGPDPNPLAPGPHVVQVSFPSPLEPSHVHLLVCPKDDDADHDKAHRKRWALQHNNVGGKGATIAFDYGGSNNYGAASKHSLRAGDEAWQPGMEAMGYSNLVGNKATTFYNRFVWPSTFILGPLWSLIGYLEPPLVDYDWTEYNDNGSRIMNALQWTDSKGYGSLQALLLVGHGDSAGSRVCIRGSDVIDPNPNPNDRTYIVSAPTDAEIADENLKYKGVMATQEKLFLSSLQAGGTNLSGITLPARAQPLTNLKLVVVAACDAAVAQSNGSIYTLQDGFLILGAKCVVAVGEVDQNESGIVEYLQVFLKALGEKNKDTHVENTVAQADELANIAEINMYGGGKIGSVGGDGGVRL